MAAGIPPHNPSCYRQGLVAMTLIEPCEQRQMDLRSDLGASNQQGLDVESTATPLNDFKEGNSIQQDHFWALGLAEHT